MKFRGFIAIDVNLPEILKFSKEIEDINANLKLVETENIHITLKFLGETEESMIDDISLIIENSVSDILPFSLNFKGVGAFPNLNYIKIIWVGIETPEPVIKIAKKLDDELTILKFKKEKKDFSPHITLARVKGPKNKQNLKSLLQNNLKRDFGKKDVESIKLKKSILSSKGAKYYLIKEIKL